MDGVILLQPPESFRSLCFSFKVGMTSLGKQKLKWGMGGRIKNNLNSRSCSNVEMTFLAPYQVKPDNLFASLCMLGIIQLSEL